MNTDWLMDALAHCKRMSNLLNEVMDLSRQMAEAIDRNDQVSVEMLVAMRREPIEQLVQSDEALRTQVDSLPQEEALRLAQLLNGMPAQRPEEKSLADQVASNGRRLKQVLELDKNLSRMLAREKSIY